DKDLYIYYVVAVIVGFREHTFRSLIGRVADVIFSPGEPKTPPASLKLRLTAVPSATNATGKSQIVRAEVSDKNDKPCVGELVCFVVTGPNAVASPPAPLVTSDQGQAVFEYVGHVAGEDRIRVFVDINGDGERQAGDPQVVTQILWT
ncbi:MAG: hypothetical protein ACRDV9_05210, partial [Acidimicrobiia bacterium]